VSRPPRGFDRETGELIDADGKKRVLSDDEMAHYWWTEAIQAMKADQPEASAHAHAKSEFYKHRARAARKQKAAERAAAKAAKTPKK
jgi:hypothetical protein